MTASAARRHGQERDSARIVGSVKDTEPELSSVIAQIHYRYLILRWYPAVEINKIHVLEFGGAHWYSTAVYELLVFK
jgi:hypothetical protein